MVARYSLYLILPWGTGRQGRRDRPVCFIEEAEAQRSETTCPRSECVSGRTRISPFLTTCLAPTCRVLTQSPPGPLHVKGDPRDSEDPLPTFPHQAGSLLEQSLARL